MPIHIFHQQLIEEAWNVATKTFPKRRDRSMNPVTQLTDEKNKPNSVTFLLYRKGKEISFHNDVFYNPDGSLPAGSDENSQKPNTLTIVVTFGGKRYLQF